MTDSVQLKRLARAMAFARFLARRGLREFNLIFSLSASSGATAAASAAGAATAAAATAATAAAAAATATAAAAAVAAAEEATTEENWKPGQSYYDAARSELESIIMNRNASKGTALIVRSSNAVMSTIKDGDTRAYAAEHTSLVMSMLIACRPDFLTGKKVSAENFYDKNNLSGFVSGTHVLLNASSFWRLVNDKLPAALTIVSAEPETDTDISAPSDDAVVLPGGPSPPPTAAVAVAAGAAAAGAAGDAAQ